MRFWKFLLPLLASTLCFAAQPDRIAGPIDSSQMVALPNHVSLFAQSRYEEGLIDSSTQLRVTMLFTPTAAQQSALQKLLADQQDPKSASFHKWLTPEQFADRFGLSQNDVDKVTAWLESQSLKVTYVARGRDSISFSGDASQVQAVFKTEFHNYSVNGKMHFANSTPPMIPVALSGVVGGFRGLHNFFPEPQLKRRPDYSFTFNGQPATAIAPGDIALLYDINPLYQSNPAIDGTNQKLVIVGQTDIYLADINDYRAGFGLSTIPSSSSSCAPSTVAGKVGVVTSPCNTTNFQYVVPRTGSDPGLSPGDLSESDLDIEVSGAVARNAQIIFVTSSNGVGDSWSWAIDNNLAPVISISYGLCEAIGAPPSLTIQDKEFQKGASQGISIFAASGDSGAAICDAFFGNTGAVYGLSVSYPASSPEVTGVGGTEFNEGMSASTYWAPPPTNSATNFGVSALRYIPELAWNDTTLLTSQGFPPGATGGGPSNCVNTSGTTTSGGVVFSNCDAPPGGGFAKPIYQSGVTPSDGVRDVPDISFSASNVNDGYIVCTPQSEVVQGSKSSTSTCVNGISSAMTTYFSAFGGTSAPTPLTAGMAALLNQYLGANGLGNINTQLYKLYGTNPTVFHDINAGTSGIGDGDTSDNIVPCTNGDPSFEPLALRCPSTGTFGYSVAGGHTYSSVTGLGSLDISAFFTAWAAANPTASFTLTAGAASPTSISAGQSASVTLTIAPVNGSTQTINFTNSTSSNPQSCSAGLPAGALCSFSPASVTLDGTNSQTVTLTISTAANMTVPSGVQTITVTGTPSGTGATSHTATVSLTVTATTETFSLGDGNIATFPVTVGGTVAVNVAVAGTNGFIVGSGAGATTALQLTYSCTGSPPLTTAEISCTISPGNGQPTNAIAVTVTLATTAPTAQLHPPLGRSRFFYALLLPGLFGFVFVAGSRTRGIRLLSLIVVLGFSTLWLGACGGSSTNTHPTNPGTPKGTYTVTIGATTGGATPITNSNAPFTIQLVVN
jgi:subtilase family serine protease